MTDIASANETPLRSPTWPRGATRRNLANSLALINPENAASISLTFRA